MSKNKIIQDLNTVAKTIDNAINVLVYTGTPIIIIHYRKNNRINREIYKNHKVIENGETIAFND